MRYIAKVGVYKKAGFRPTQEDGCPLIEKYFRWSEGQRSERQRRDDRRSEFQKSEGQSLAYTPYEDISLMNKKLFLRVLCVVEDHHYQFDYV